MLTTINLHFYILIHVTHFHQDDRNIFQCISSNKCYIREVLYECNREPKGIAKEARTSGLRKCFCFIHHQITNLTLVQNENIYFRLINIPCRTRSKQLDLCTSKTQIGGDTMNGCKLINEKESDF